MNSNPLSEKVLELLRGAADGQPPLAGPHVADDEELLTCWSLGQLRPAEKAALMQHLADCASCRRRVAALIEGGLLEAPATDEPATVPFTPPPQRQVSARLGWALALAAALLLAVFVGFLIPRGGPEAQLAQARRDLAGGRAVAALERAEKVLGAAESPALRERARQLLEEASYVAARTELEAGRFDQVAALDQRVAPHLAERSPRLRNVVLQAERGISAEITLAHAGSLTDYGYPLTGEPIIKSLVVREAADQRFEKQLKEALARHPRDPRLLMNHGQFLLKFNEYAEAREQFRSALEAGGQDAAAHLGLGLIDYEDKEYVAALKHFQAAAHLAPDSAPAHLNAAIALTLLKRPEEAKVPWERAEELTRDAKLRKNIRAYRARTETGGYEEKR